MPHLSLSTLWFYCISYLCIHMYWNIKVLVKCESCITCLASPGFQSKISMLICTTLKSVACWFQLRVDLFSEVWTPHQKLQAEVYRNVVICADLVLAGPWGTFKAPSKLCVSSCKMQLNCNSFLLCCLINFRILLRPLYLCWPRLSIKCYQKASVFQKFSDILSA